MSTVKLIFPFLVLCIVQVHGFYEDDMTADVPAGKRECYFQNVKVGLALEIEYQVIDGGDLDIDFQVIEPSGNVLTSEFRKSDGSFRVSPTTAGDYEICFDNSFSRFTGKSVFFEIIIDDDSEDYDSEDEEWKRFTSQNEAIEDHLAAIEIAHENVRLIKVNNAKSLQLQGILRVHEAKDRNVAERNYHRINFWSVVNIIVMLSVVALQVYMIRNMFSDTRKVRT